MRLPKTFIAPVIDRVKDRPTKEAFAELIRILDEQHKDIFVDIQKLSGGIPGYGDMFKSTYDTDNDGNVDGAETVDDGDGNVSSAVDVKDAVAKKHTEGDDQALGALGTKATPVDADKVIQRDSEDSDALKTSTWAQIKAFLKTYFDGLYEVIGAVAAHLIAFNHALLHTQGTDTELGTQTEELDMGGYRVIEGGDPSNLQDLITLNYFLNNLSEVLDYWLEASQTLSETLTESEGSTTELVSGSPDTLGDIYFKSIVAETPTPLDIKEGTIIAVHFDAETVNANKKPATVICQLWRTDSDGVSNPAQIGADSDETGVLTTVKTNYHVHLHVSSNTPVVAGSRFWIKYVITTTGPKQEPTIRVYHGTDKGHLTIPVAGTVLGNFLRNNVDDETTGNLGQVKDTPEFYQTHSDGTKLRWYTDATGWHVKLLATVAGALGKAIEPTDRTGRVTITTPGSFSHTAFTYLTCIKVNSEGFESGTGNSIFQFVNAASANALRFTWDFHDKHLSFYDATALAWVDTGIVLAVGGTYFIGLTYDGDKLRFYVDGALDTGVADYTSASFTIASAWTAMYFFASPTSWAADVFKDQTGYYNSVLATPKLAEYYNGGAGRFAELTGESAVGRWSFDEASGNAVDLTGNGHTGVVSGNTQRVPGKVTIPGSETEYEILRVKENAGPGTKFLGELGPEGTAFCGAPMTTVQADAVVLTASQGFYYFDTTTSTTHLREGESVNIDLAAIPDSRLAQIATANKVALGSLTLLNTLANKATPVDADGIAVGDSESSWALKYTTFTQIKAFMKTYWDGIYQTLSNLVTTLAGADDTHYPSALAVADAIASPVVEEFTASGGVNESFTLTSPYVLSADSLWISRNGKELSLANSEWAEVDTTHFTIGVTVAGDKIKAKIISTLSAVKGFQSKARAYRVTNNQNIAANTHTKLEFNAESYDILNEYDIASNFRFTATETGYYLIVLKPYIVPNADTYGELKIYRNGVSVSTTGYVNLFTTIRNPLLMISDVIYLTAGQYLEGYFWIDTQTAYMQQAENISYMSIHRLS